jgi:RasGEF domain
MTWQALSEEDTHRFDAFDSLCSPIHNSAVLRSMQSHAPLPVVPYAGLLSKDLVAAKEIPIFNEDDQVNLLKVRTHMRDRSTMCTSSTLASPHVGSPQTHLPTSSHLAPISPDLTPTDLLSPHLASAHSLLVAPRDLSHCDSCASHPRAATAAACERTSAQLAPRSHTLDHREALRDFVACGTARPHGCWQTIVASLRERERERSVFFLRGWHCIT